MDWDLRSAIRLLIPSFLICLVAASFLWLVVGTGWLQVPLPLIGGIAAWALCIANTSINGMKSRQSSDAIAFRKRLAAGRAFFMQELSKPKPELQDNWYPWVLAFGLSKHLDAWSSRQASSSTGSYATTYDSQSSSISTPGSHSWTGGGGLSGGAGASGAWAAAAVGMAAGVSDSSSGSSSSGGSSGGGGGGGW